MFQTHQKEVKLVKIFSTGVAVFYSYSILHGVREYVYDKNRNCPSHLPDMELYTATQHRGVILTIES